MYSMFRVISLFTASYFIVGCSLTAPQYTASLTNVQKLKDGGISTAKVGTFASSNEKGNKNPISLRGSSLNSPYSASYAEYLAIALKQDLELANRFAADSKIEVSGVLKKNDLDSSGFSVGTGDIAAHFVVKNDNTVRYSADKSAHIEWESSFVGGIAIPRAQQSYSLLVQELLSNLFADPAFLAAIKN